MSSGSEFMAYFLLNIAKRFALGCQIAVRMHVCEQWIALTPEHCSVQILTQLMEESVEPQCDNWCFRWEARTLGIWWSFAGPHSYEAVDMRCEHIYLSLWFGLCVALIALSICHPCCPWMPSMLPKGHCLPHPTSLSALFNHNINCFPLDFEKGQTKRCLYGGREATFPEPSCFLDFTVCGPSVCGLRRPHSSLTGSRFFTLKC